MAKYRLLNKEELKLLEKEFVDFLVLNGITAEDWEDMKTQSVEKADEMITIFSDMIIEGSLLKTSFLEHISKKRLASIHFQKDQMVIVVMEAPEQENADFTDSAFIKIATESPPSYLNIYSKTFPYINPREITIWEYTLEGWGVSNGNLYKSLCLGL